jgi:DedD protein
VKEGLKQRLVGAFVLAALAVIFLPGIFREQQGHQVDTRSQIPPRPQVEIVEFTAPEPQQEVEPAPAPETMFVPSETSEPEQVSNASEIPASSAVAQSSSSAAPQLTLNEKGIPEAWVVQVVSLSNKAAAIKLRDELQADGYKAFVREVTTASGTFNRLFIGPKLDKAEAMAIKAELDQRLSVSAQVRRFEP